MTLRTRKKLLLTAIAMMAATTTTAAPRTKAQMQEAAATAINAQRAAKRMAPRHTTDIKTLKATATYEILGFDNAGFAVVATDDLVPAVLGVSTATWSEGRNTNFQWWLQAMEHAVSYAVSNNIQLVPTKPDPTKYPAAVPPMVTTHWDQDEPYSNLCPTYSGTTKCLTGCVATAMAQVLNYHKTPEHGIGQRTIYYSYQPVTADFENDYYDWDNMLDEYVAGQYNDTEAQAVAMLMRDCGVAANMEYGGPEEGSGAYSQDAADGLRRYFGIEEATCLERDNYSQAQWMDIVFTELSESRPLYYGGTDWLQGGHAFVIHGYDADGMVYVNWGWSGDDDGYYDISLLNPPGISFSYGQDMITGIQGAPRELDNVEVTLTEPGTLQSLLGDEAIGNVGTLKVTGDINSSDLLFLRKLAGVNETGDKTEGVLYGLDLSQARFVTGGNPYLIDGSKKLTITTNDELPQQAFYNCRRLRTLALPAGLHHYGDGTLARCMALSELSIGTPADDADFIIDESVVWNKDKTEIVAILPTASGTLAIARGTTALHDYAVAGCSRLSRVTLPLSLAKIGREGFRDCSSLSELRVSTKDAPELGGADVFAGINVRSCKLYVPSGSKTKYSRLAQWNGFRGDGYDCIVEYGSTVKVRNSIRYYGEENPKLAYRVEGDPIEGEPVLSCEATPLSPAGRYPITITAGTISDENVELVDGYLIVQKVKATATVDNCTREQGQPNPVFTLSYTGLVNDELHPVWTEEPVITTTANADSPIGEYPIIVEAGTAESYEMTFVAGTLTVTEATTGIMTPSDGSATNQKDNQRIYDLQGRPVNPSRLNKGIYITNGKKIVR